MSDEKVGLTTSSFAATNFTTMAVSITVCSLAILGVGAVIYFLLTGGANEK